jgi:bifunctional non-homologous end joining protein LigD
VIAYLDARGPRLLDADGKDRSRTFSRIAAALAAIAGGRSAILDGEIAAPDADGITHRGDGARRGDRRRLAFFAFDLLWLDGKDLRQRGLLARKRALKAFLKGAKAPIFYVDHVSGDDGAELYGEVVRRGGAGILCRRKHAHYLEGRSTTWLEVRPDAVKARQMEALRQSVARERARQGR